MDQIDRLFNAVGAGDAAAVRAILERDPAAARAQNAATLHVLAFARYAGFADVLEALIAAGPPLSVFEAAMIDHAGRIREIVRDDAGAARAYSADGFTSLHFAGYFGALSAIDALLAAGADIEAKTTNFLANMPLHAAAAGGRIDACRRLVERGANVNARQHGGFMPLHTAAFHNSREMAELFLAAGADPAGRDDEGKTPADRASMQGNMELAALLRAREAVRT